MSEASNASNTSSANSANSASSMNGANNMITKTYDDNNIPSIASSAMLVDLSISVWTARKKDKNVTEDVLITKRADKKAGAFNKNLLVDCDELTAIQKFSANTRALHYRLTMPWSDSGLRLLPTAKFFDYNKIMSQKQSEFDKMVEDFVDVYNSYVQQMYIKLGDLFVADEYPSASVVKNKFAFRMSYIPVPEIGDWRVDLENEARVALKEQYEKFYQKQTERAVQSKIEELRKQLTTFIRQLTVTENEKGRIFESTIDNIRELAEFIGVSNFMNDGVISEVHEALDSALAGVCKDDLIENPKFREKTREEMQKVLKSLPSLGWDDEE
jgi:hypothetical protein